MNNVVTEHLGGTDMNFAVHLNNWGEVTLTANNCEFLATYCGVRAFNSGYDNNNIKITNSKLTGATRAFWVHNYFGDFTDARHTEEAVIARLKIDIYNNNNTFEITGEAKSPIRYGFISPVYFDETGKKVYPEDPVFNITSSNTETLTTAVATPDATVEIAAGTYTFPKSFAKGVTVVCEEGTVFDGGSSAISLDINGATVIGAEFTSSADRVITGTVNGTIKDCTFTGDRALRYCYAGETCVFENCVFDGVVYGVHFDGGENDATFRNCTFSGFNTFGHAITLLTLENCNFKSNGKSDYNGVNLWGNTNLVGTKFYFDGQAANEWISAASADIEISFTDCEIVDSEKSLTDWLDESNDPGTVFTINGDTYTTK